MIDDLEIRQPPFVTPALDIAPPSTQRINQDHYYNPCCVAHPKRESLSMESFRSQKDVMYCVNQSIQVAPSREVQRDRESMHYVQVRNVSYQRHRAERP